MRFVIGFGEGVAHGDKTEAHGEEGQPPLWANSTQGHISWPTVKHNEVLLALGLYHELCGG
jgi:hypothetical protein